MFLICPTRSLAKKLHVSLKETDPTAPGPGLLCEWYCNDFKFSRTDLAVFVSSDTYLPVVLKAAPYRTLVERFQTELKAYLDKLGYPSLAQSSSPAEFSKTSNRSVLGVINQFIMELEAEDYLGRLQPEDTPAMTTRLGSTLIGGPKYKKPLERLAERAGPPTNEPRAQLRLVR